MIPRPKNGGSFFSPNYWYASAMLYDVTTHHSLDSHVIIDRSDLVHHASVVEYGLDEIKSKKKKTLFDIKL